MATANSKPTPVIGVDKYTFFEVTSDTADGVAYGAPYSLPGTVQISPSDSGGSDTFDADNGAYVVDTYLEDLGHEIENADVPPEVDAMWRGLELKNGALIVDGLPKTVYFGVAWRLLKADGTYRYVKYFKGAYSLPSNVGGKTKPSSGASEKQTAKSTYTAVKRDYDNRVYMYIDQSDIVIKSGASSSDKNTFASLEAFEDKWFSDMGVLLDDTKITTATA
jgi:phi13 family phage major tail protein